MTGSIDNTWEVQADMELTEAEAGDVTAATDPERDFLSAIWVPVATMSCTMKEKSVAPAEQ